MELSPKPSLHEQTTALMGKQVMYKGRKLHLESWRKNDDGSVVLDITYLDVALPESGDASLLLEAKEVEQTVAMWLKQVATQELLKLGQPREEDVQEAPPEPEDRYFILFYSAVKIVSPRPNLLMAPGVVQQPKTPQRQEHTGDLCITTHGHYPNKGQVMDYIKNKVGFTTVSINNIVEVSEGDMRTWELPFAKEEA